MPAGLDVPFATVIVLERCRVIDVRTGDCSEPASIAIEGDRIVDVGEGRGDGAERHDLGGAYVIPGLIDCHVHVTAGTADLAAMRRWPASYAAAHAAARMAASLRRGFTRVRDVGGADWGIARAVAEGLVTGPVLHFGGRALSQTGGHGDLRAPGEPAEEVPAPGAMTRVVDGAEAIRAAAREELRLGAHHIKLMLSGGVASPTDPVHRLQYSDAEIVAAVEEAAVAGAYVAGHCYPATGVRRAAELGVCSIEHANYADEEALRAVLANGAFLVPTLSVYELLASDGEAAGLPSASVAKVGDLFDAGLETLGRADALGVPLAFGTDLIGDLERHQSYEFAVRGRVQAPLDVLRSATRVAAELLGLAGDVGAVMPGFRADLVALAGDPREDVTVLAEPERFVRLVVAGGRLHPPP